MAELSIPPEQEPKVIAAMEENKRRLGSCTTPHDFKRVNPGSNNMRCSKCHGYVSLSAGAYYIKGLQHGQYSQLTKQGVTE